MNAILFDLMLQRFNSAEVAGRITNRITAEAEQGEQHARDYLRNNLEFTKPTIKEIADILFRSKFALSPMVCHDQR